MSNREKTYRNIVKIESTDAKKARFSPISVCNETQKHFGRVTEKSAQSFLEKFISSFEKSNGITVLSASLYDQFDFTTIANYNA